MAQTAVSNRYFVNQFISSFIEEERFWGKTAPKTQIIWVDDLPEAQDAVWLPEPAGYAGYRCMSAMTGRQINRLNNWMAEQLGQIFAGAAGYFTYREILYVKRSIWTEYDPAVLTGPSEHKLRKEELFFTVTDVTEEEFRTEIRQFINNFYPNWVERAFISFANEPEALRRNECNVSLHLVRRVGDHRSIPVFKYWREEPKGSGPDKITQRWVVCGPGSGHMDFQLRDAIWHLFKE